LVKYRKKKIKNLIKKNKNLHQFLLTIRDKLRIFYNQKRRSRFFWELRDGDIKLSLIYPLDSNSTFIDVGGHLGDYSAAIYKKYKCNIYAFEPLLENFETIDFVKMNIEGSEYELLEEIIESGNILKITHLQIQFHNFVENATERRKNIRNKLKKTHVNIFNFPFIWERWDIKNDK